MIKPVLKLSEIKKNPSCMIGCEDYPESVVIRYGDVVAYVLTPERMIQLLEIEKKLKGLQ